MTTPNTLKEAYNYLVFTGLVKNQKKLAEMMNSYPACVSNAINGNPKYLTQRIQRNLTTYWARHTWATIAADLDIPDADIIPRKQSVPKGN